MGMMDFFAKCYLKVIVVAAKMIYFLVVEYLNFASQHISIGTAIFIWRRRSKMRGIIYNKNEAFVGCERAIAIAEMSAGNETIGSAWLETKSFDKNTPISEILLWAHNIGVTGKVVITLDLGTEIQEVPDGKDRD